MRVRFTCLNSLAALSLAAACGDDAGSGGADTSTSTSSQSVSSTSSAPSVSSSASSSATSSSSSGSGGSADTFSDEFDDPSTTPDWALGPSDAYNSFDIAMTTGGLLTVVIEQYAVGELAFWHDLDQGFFLYKTVSGDFAVRVRTEIDSYANPGMDPTGAFHAAGIMARDPISDQSSEGWVLYDLGHQNGMIPWGTRAAHTQTSDTSQVLTASANNVTSGELVMCRLGATFHLFRRLDGETAWTAEKPLTRTDFPSELQVGMVVNAGYANNPDMVATFDYARLTIPNSVADCTADM